MAKEIDNRQRFFSWNAAAAGKCVAGGETSTKMADGNNIINLQK